MIGLICKKPGEFVYRNLDNPVPKKSDVLIKIERIGVCGTDIHAFEGTQPYFEYPRIFGHEISGYVVDPRDNSEIQTGDKVTIIPYFNCGQCIACRAQKTNCCVHMKVCGVHMDGGMVEYLSIPARYIIKNNMLSFDQLALIEPQAIAAHGIRRAEVKKDDFVLVIGAGPIGLGAMEFARLKGGRVIAMDINESRLSFCKDNLHIDHVIKAGAADIVGQLSQITNGDMPAVVIDATGNLNAINNAFQYMAHGGKYVLIGLQSGDISFSHPEFHKREGTLMSSRNATKEDFEYVIQAVTLGDVNPLAYVTHRVKFMDVKDRFNNLIKSENLIKLLIEMN